MLRTIIVLDIIAIFTQRSCNIIWSIVLQQKLSMTAALLRPCPVEFSIACHCSWSKGGTSCNTSAAYVLQVKPFIVTQFYCIAVAFWLAYWSVCAFKIKSQVWRPRPPPFMDILAIKLHFPFATAIIHDFTWVYYTLWHDTGWNNNPPPFARREQLMDNSMLIVWKCKPLQIQGKCNLRFNSTSILPRLPLWSKLLKELPKN